MKAKLFSVLVSRINIRSIRPLFFLLLFFVQNSVQYDVEGLRWSVRARAPKDTWWCCPQAVLARGGVLVVLVIFFCALPCVSTFPSLSFLSFLVTPPPPIVAATPACYHSPQPASFFGPCHTTPLRLRLRVRTPAFAPAPTLTRTPTVQCMYNACTMHSG